MPSPLPFLHDGPVFVLADDHCEIAYYARGYCKYKRVRELGLQTWQETTEQEIDQDHFWMVAACIERGRGFRRGLA